MRRLTTAALLLLTAIAMPASAQRRRAVPAVGGELAIAFVDVESGDGSMVPAGSDAWLDLNRVRHDGGGRARSTRIRRRFGIRVTRSGRGDFGSAVVTARLASLDARATYRLDGRLLTTAPVVAEAHAAIGQVTMHTLDIEVPVTSAEGALAASIEWEVRNE